MFDKSGWHHFHLNYRGRWHTGNGLGSGYPAGNHHGKGSGQAFGEYFNQRHLFEKSQPLAERPVYIVGLDYTGYRTTHRHYDSLMDLWVDVTLRGLGPWPPSRS